MRNTMKELMEYLVGNEDAVLPQALNGQENEPLIKWLQSYWGPENPEGNIPSEDRPPITDSFFNYVADKCDWEDDGSGFQKALEQIVVTPLTDEEVEEVDKSVEEFHRSMADAIDYEESCEASWRQAKFGR